MANKSQSYYLYSGGTATSSYLWFVWEGPQSGTDVRRDELNYLSVLSFQDETNQVKVLFSPMFSDFRRSTAFGKVPRLRPFVLLVRATCR